MGGTYMVFVVGNLKDKIQIRQNSNFSVTHYIATGLLQLGLRSNAFGNIAKIPNSTDILYEHYLLW